MTCNVCALCFSHNREAWWLFPGGSGAFMVSKCYWTPRIVSLVTYLKRLFVHQTLLSMSKKMYWFINQSKLLLCKHDALFSKKSREVVKMNNVFVHVGNICIKWIFIEMRWDLEYKLSEFVIIKIYFGESFVWQSYHTLCLISSNVFVHIPYHFPMPEQIHKLDNSIATYFFHSLYLQVIVSVKFRSSTIRYLLISRQIVQLCSFHNRSKCSWKMSRF